MIDRTGKDTGKVHAQRVEGDVPLYMNLSGDRLITAIVITSTMGFALFGYDQGIVSAPIMFWPLE